MLRIISSGGQAMTSAVHHLLVPRNLIREGFKKHALHTHKL